MNTNNAIERFHAIRPRPVLPPLWREVGAIREGLKVMRKSPRAPLRELPAPGSEVMLIPGFLAGDSSMRLLARFLERAGYVTVGSEIARNVDCSEATVNRLEALLEQRAREAGSLTIVGHSRGGLLARVLGRRNPELVSGVVTLGSPLRDQLAVHPALYAQIVGVALAGSAGAPGTLSLACSTGPCCARFRSDLDAPLPPRLPLVSVYSRRDGVVDWRSCREREGVSVEVTATHVGMIAHADTFRVVLEALDGFTRRAARQTEFSPHEPRVTAALASVA